MPAARTNRKGTILLDGENLQLEQAVAIARKNQNSEFAKAALARRAKQRMAKSRELVEQWADGTAPIYGINTGFGDLQDTRILPQELETLQENLVLSHLTGVGEPLPGEVVRAMIVLRANALAKGYSGVRIEVVERLLELLDTEIYPEVPAKGSVGSSGDLAPLAHMTAVLIGRGWAIYRGERMPGAEALKRAGMQPIRLQAKEGLALINGTQMMTAVGVLALCDAGNLARVADIAGAMSFEALMGRSSPFLEAAHKLRPFPGQKDCASNIRKITCLESTRAPRSRLIDLSALPQDSYSIRCMPQVHGASRDAFAFVRRVLETEINSATDNPLIIPGLAKPLEAGNFHGQPVALAMDFLALALSEIGSISERRIAYLIDRRRNRGLEPFLIKESGLNSGLMLAQYTAAALASENKVLIHPASGDSIPTSVNQEDHNSMGSIAARQAREVLENVERILAIELICAAQALGLREQKMKEQKLSEFKPGAGTGAAYQLIRKRVPQLNRDEELYPYIQAAIELVHSGALARAVERVIGPLK